MSIGACRRGDGAKPSKRKENSAFAATEQPQARTNKPQGGREFSVVVAGPVDTSAGGAPTAAAAAVGTRPPRLKYRTNVPMESRFCPHDKKYSDSTLMRSLLIDDLFSRAHERQRQRQRENFVVVATLLSHGRRQEAAS